MMIMNKEQQDLQFLGLFGIYKESYKIILSWRKIFTKITLSLILPLSFMFLIQIQVSNSLFTKIINHSQQIISTPQDTPQFKRLSQTVSSEWVTFLVFKVFYLAFSIIFSLLTTSAISYTISLFYASTHDDEVVNLRKAISIVPKICARLMTTFLCVFVALLVYNFVAVLVFIILALTINAYAGTENYAVLGVASVFSIILVLTYLVGLFYLSLIWQLSNSVTVLEDSYGFEAMKKSKELIKGKMGLSLLLFFTIIVSYGLIIHFLFMMVVVQGWNMNSVVRIAYSILCLLLLSHQILLGQVTQTVLYFVCKCYHKQNIDKFDLSIYLEYQPLKNKDVC